jgi:hypothetical protein
MIMGYHVLLGPEVLAIDTGAKTQRDIPLAGFEQHARLLARC